MGFTNKEEKGEKVKFSRDQGNILPPWGALIKRRL